MADRDFLARLVPLQHHVSKADLQIEFEKMIEAAVELSVPSLRLEQMNASSLLAGSKANDSDSGHFCLGWRSRFEAVNSCWSSPSS